MAIGSLHPGSVKINRAEFLAAMITCETFADHCTEKFTTLAVDNHSARSWVNSARCPIFPFDRFAQGVHLFMLERSMKIKAHWIPSSSNKIADTVSRKTFVNVKKTSIHVIAGLRLKKVRPKWHNVLKFV